MAITATHLTTSGNTADASSYATASITPTANALVLAWVYTIDAAAPTVATASGNGLTWVEVGNSLDSNGIRQIVCFRAMGASPSAGAVTFDFAGDTQSGAVWSVAEFTGVDTTGSNGSGAVVQAIAASSASNGAAQTITLTTLVSTANLITGAFGIPRNTAATPAPGSGFTQLGQRNQTSPNIAIMSEYRVPSSTSDTAVVGDWTGLSLPSSGVALEIKVASSGTTVTPSVLSHTLTGIAPSVIATANQSVAPSVLALTTTQFAPAVTATDHKILAPGQVSLTTTLSVPNVTATDNKTVTPDVVALATSSFSPLVTATDTQIVTPATAALSTASFNPSVAIPGVYVPSLASLTIGSFAPTITTTVNQAVTPSVSNLTITAYASSVVASDNKSVTPSFLALTTTKSTPAATVSDNKIATPDVASLVTALFAPVLDITQDGFANPELTILQLLGYAPQVTRYTFLQIGNYPTDGTYTPAEENSVMWTPDNSTNDQVWVVDPHDTTTYTPSDNVTHGSWVAN